MKQRWLARLAFLAAFGSVVVLLAGGRDGLAVLAVGILGLATALAGVWWFLANRGIARWCAAALVIGALVAVLVFYSSRGRLLDVVLALLLGGVAAAAGRAALAPRSEAATGMPEEQTPPPAQPYLIMNPRSGGGKVRRFDLDTKAEAMGAEVALLAGPAHVDVADLARTAAAEGADLLGVAGGDGTQALVAGIAAQRGLPFLVISAGTRNHFAMDLGLDRERPDLGLDALTDGVELRLDLGMIGDRTFVNNASFGAYAEIVQSPAYRDDKVGTTLQLLPDILSGHQGPRLTVRVDEDVAPIEAPKAVLVSNNPYYHGDLAGLGRRARLDTGQLGVVVITVDSAAQAVDLLGRHPQGLSTGAASTVVIDADVPEIPVGIDGETVLMPTPVRCTIQPLALRVRVPRTRPGVSVEKPPVDWALLRRQALTMGHLARGDAQPRRP